MKKRKFSPYLLTEIKHGEIHDGDVNPTREFYGMKVRTINQVPNRIYFQKVRHKELRFVLV